MKKIRIVFVIFTLLMVSACNLKEEKRESVTLLFHGMNDSLFDLYFTDLVKEHLPHIQLEFIPTDVYGGIEHYELSVEFPIIHEYQPDVMMFGYGHASLIYLVEEVSLLPLDAYISDLDDYPEFVIQALRNFGGDQQLYGLPIDFGSSAIFINTSLFDQYNVEYPSGSVSWGELLKLAQAFPSHNADGLRQVGWFDETSKLSPDLRIHDLLMRAGASHYLTLGDIETGQITIDTPMWRKLWNDILNSPPDDLNNDDSVVPITDNYHLNLYGLFLEGRVAMLHARSEIIKYLVENSLTFEWTMVPHPGTYQVWYSGGSVYTVNQNTKYPDEAVELISLLTSEKAVNAQQGLMIGSLPINLDLFEEQHSIDLSALTALEPLPGGQYYFINEDLPDEYLSFYYTESLESIRRILDNESTVEEELKLLQQKAEVELVRWLP